MWPIRKKQESRSQMTQRQMAVKVIRGNELMVSLRIYFVSWWQEIWLSLVLNFNWFNNPDTEYPDALHCKLARNTHSLLTVTYKMQYWCQQLCWMLKKTLCALLCHAKTKYLLYRCNTTLKPSNAAQNTPKTDTWNHATTLPRCAFFTIFTHCKQRSLSEEQLLTQTRGWDWVPHPLL